MKTEPLTPPAPADGDLIAQCLAGETTAFAILIDRHRQRLERLLRALLRDQWELRPSTGASRIIPSPTIPTNLFATRRYFPCALECASRQAHENLFIKAIPQSI